MLLVVSGEGTLLIEIASFPFFLFLVSFPVTCRELGEKNRSSPECSASCMFYPLSLTLSNLYRVRRKEGRYFSSGNQPALVFILPSPQLVLAWLWYYPHWLQFSTAAGVCLPSVMGDWEKMSRNNRLPAHPPQCSSLSTLSRYLPSTPGHTCPLILRGFSHLLAVITQFYTLSFLLWHL